MIVIVDCCRIMILVWFVAINDCIFSLTISISKLDQRCDNDYDVNGAFDVNDRDDHDHNVINGPIFSLTLIIMIIVLPMIIFQPDDVKQSMIVLMMPMIMMIMTRVLISSVNDNIFSLTMSSSQLEQRFDNYCAHDTNDHDDYDKSINFECQG